MNRFDCKYYDSRNEVRSKIFNSPTRRYRTGWNDNFADIADKIDDYEFAYVDFWLDIFARKGRDVTQ